jgi:hypothetical protein
MTDKEAIFQIEDYLKDNDAYVSVTAIRIALNELKNKDYKENHLLKVTPINKAKAKIKKSKGGRTVMTIPLMQEINRLYDSGLSVKEVSEILNLTYGLTKNYVWHMRSKGGNPIE